MVSIKHILDIPFKTVKRKVAFTLPIYESKSVASLEEIEIGGIKQHILVRGNNVKNPILLFVHGGPGCSMIGLVRHFHSELEKHFVVVSWDQRGCCKSYDKKIPKKDMTLDNFVQDCHELIGKLKKRFKKKKIYLVGHSWGSIVGTLVAKKYPKDLHAYIGVSQVVDMLRAEEVAHDFCVDVASDQNDKKALKELKKFKWMTPKLGDKYLKRVDVERKYVHEYGGSIYGRRDINNLIKVIVHSVEYTLKDLFNLVRGWDFSVKCLWRDMVKIEFSKQVKELKVPVYFLQGKYDYQTPAILVKEYYKILKAPKKKVFWFEKSAHNPLFEEPEKFNKILVKILKENS